jgi:hypothetical protein
MDARILNFALLLEYVEFAISEDAPTRAPLTGDLLDFARKVGRQERANVRILQDSFGSATRSRPTFQFGEATSDPEMFSTTALLLEETALAAYIDRPVLLIDVVDASDTGGRTDKANPPDAFFPIAQIERIEGIDEDGLFRVPTGESLTMNAIQWIDVGAQVGWEPALGWEGESRDAFGSR